jgi:hypothetical protein
MDAASADAVAPATETAAEPSSLSTTPASSPQAFAGSTSAFTWQLLSHEYCLDRFGTTCPNGATSADPCPFADPAGKPCSVLFDRCWSVLSAYWADEYRCAY